MKNNIIIISCIAIIALIIFLSGYKNKNSDSFFKIGVDLMLTGSLSESQEAFRDGIQIAVDEINGKGGINGKQIQLIVEDDHMEPSKMTSIAQKLTSVDKVDAAIVSSFINVETAGNIYESTHTPVIVLWDSNPQIDAMGKYIFGIGPWTPSAGEVSAEYSYNELGARTAVAIATNEPWPVEVVDAFKKKFESLGGKVLDTSLVNLGQGSDFKSVITKSIGLKPDILYTPISENSTRFYQQLSILKFPGKVVTSDIITESVIKESGNATNGIYQTQPLDPIGEIVEHMNKLYKEKFGKESKNVLYNAWGYDAVGLITTAAKNTETREEIKDALYLIKNYPGASSMLTITEGGSAPSIEKMFRIQDGKFILMK